MSFRLPENSKKFMAGLFGCFLAAFTCPVILFCTSAVGVSFLPDSNDPNLNLTVTGIYLLALCAGVLLSPLVGILFGLTVFKPFLDWLEK